MVGKSKGRISPQRRHSKKKATHRNRVAPACHNEREPHTKQQGPSVAKIIIISKVAREKGMVTYANEAADRC